MNQTKPFCTSIRCAGNISHKPVLKENARDTDDKCPDCKSFLLWAVPRKKRQIPLAKMKHRDTNYERLEVWP